MESGLNGLGTSVSNLSDRVDDCFQSVSDGKELLADAITDKGVPASASEDFANLAGKVRMITTTSLAGNIKYTYHSHTSGCDGPCGGTMDKIRSDAIGNGKWNKVYLCRSCRKEWSTTSSDQPGTRPCPYDVNKCGKTTNTIEKAEITF